MSLVGRNFVVGMGAAIALVVSAPAGAAEVIRMEEEVIEGEVQKPQVEIILQRSGKVRLDVDVRNLRPRMTAGYRDVLDRHASLFKLGKP